MVEGVMRWWCAAIALAGCNETCLGAEGDCTIPTPCEQISFECTGGTTNVRTLEAGDPVPGGLDALAADGDVVLENGIVTAVIDALDHPHYIAPTGGHLLDLASGDNDSLNHVFHAVGLLPGDSVAYETLETEDGDGFAAVQVHGFLAGRPEVRVSTRYEIRPCEPGVRVRTEIMNGANENRVWTLVDAWYWSGRETLPFAPGEDRGFDQPGLVSPVSDSWEHFPFMAAASHSDPAASYFEVACNEEELYGFHTEQVSAVGLRPRNVPPRDFEVFERFIGVVPGRDIGPAADVALELRRQLHGERWVELSGTVVVEGGGELGDEARATIVIIEGDEDTPEDERVPQTQVTPGADGTWRARVPSGRRYLLEVQVFGRTALVVPTAVRDEAVDAGTITIPGAAELELSVLVDGVPDHAQVFVLPADAEEEENLRGRLLGGFVDCAPLLGSPTGGSPACDRVLVNDPVTVQVPPGRYAIYATVGLFATIDRAQIEVEAGDRETIALELERLPIAPAGTLSADFHVHGATSFDSTIPDLDRVQAFLAASIDVVAATDHDAIWTYEDARQELGADERMRVMIGVETTGHILFDLTPGAELPQVIGHWIAWPLPFDPSQPYNGAPWDELVEPGGLFTRFVEAGLPIDTGVIQLNHPWTHAQFGRDLGFPRAVGVDANLPLPSEFDGTGQSLVRRTPDGADFANDAYHAQEVMNGTANEDVIPYRAYWFYLLNQGIVRAGTANSDSHSLYDSVLGTPRNLVWTDQTLASFDEAAFNRSVREGRMIGTNGPILEVSTTDTSGDARAPSLESFAPAGDAMLNIRVSAAPWVPIDEVRIIVNGVLARTLQAELTHPVDPFGTEGIVRFDDAIALSEILPDGDADAWIVVEAGAALPLAGDLNCDAIPDTGDNDENGVVDWRDVDRNDDDVVDELDTEGIEEPEACDPDAAIGPLLNGPRPTYGQAGYDFVAVTPHGYPLSFTNPLLLDRDGGGFAGPGLPGAP
jgi:hypothetical protein